MSDVSEKLNAVQLCTVKAKKVLFKDGVPAERIEQIVLEENGFTLVSQKDLYSIGDKVLYIQPDFNLPDTPLFEGFIRPNGDPKKSILGSKHRIRAKKFNFLTEENEIIYSIGILLPITDVTKHIPKLNLEGDLTEQLGIWKYSSENDAMASSGVVRGGFEYPSGYYKTDEPNWYNVKNRVQFGKRFIGTLKDDGSSITIFYENDLVKGIGSRTLVRPFKIRQKVGVRKKTLLERIKSFFGKKINLNVFELVDSDDKFILIAKEIFEKLQTYCIENKVSIALRGEACGTGWGGSGNAKNPMNNQEPSIHFFGADYIVNGMTVKMDRDSFNKVVKDLGLTTTTVIFDQRIETSDEMESLCKEYFKSNLCEGIVVRDVDSKTSFKYMNPEYDAKK